MYKHGGRLCCVKAGGIYRATCLLSFSRPHVFSGRLCACAVIVDATAVVCAPRAISDVESVASAPTMCGSTAYVSVVK